ncbi:MAG: sigma 54-interacting transcriptional regulator, partial [Rhodocyclaceae bacterium]|nr:sigma 54-interacting transcriptional regulator [Rhodocyclaceae bacterium]
KLLRAIQEKQVRRVGATTEEPVNVRIICATHQNLRQRVDENKFRPDLFFRINVIEIRMPALRQCSDDVPDLARRILDRLAAASDQAAPPITARALATLRDYAFPGNVRELENILERALALHGNGAIDVADLQLQPEKVGAGETAPVGAPWNHETAPADAPRKLETAQETAESGGRPLQDYLDEQERKAILDALQKTRFNRTAAARILGVSFRSLRYRMERLGLNDAAG